MLSPLRYHRSDRCRSKLEQFNKVGTRYVGNVGRTHWHVNTKIEVHLTDHTSIIFKHINVNAGC